MQAGGPSAIMTVKKEKRMSIMAFSLVVAMLVCVLLLFVFWLFTISPLGRRIEENERRRGPQLS